MRTTTFRSSLIASLVVAGALIGVPGIAAAQQQPARTHVVVPGETLWRIASEELHDGHRWREILELNRELVSEPRFLRSGIVLRLPDGVSAARGANDSAGRRAVPEASNAPDTEGAIAAAARDAGRDAAVVDSLTRSARSTPDTQGRTIFAQPDPADVPALSRANVGMAPAPTVRAGEFYAAPWPAAAPPEPSGRIASTADQDRNAVSGIARSVQLFERVIIEPPSGMRPVAGDRLLAWRPGPQLPQGALVVVPVGILTVERSSADDDGPVIGRVTSSFETISIGTSLVPLAAPPAAELATPHAVTNGREGRVLWVERSPALASLQTYLVIDLGADDGLRAGDQIELFRVGSGAAGAAAGAGSSVAGAEFRIATASVVRVTNAGASAIVIAQREPAISAGARVRVSAAVP